MASQAVENPSRARRWVEQWKELLDAPVATYHIVLWCVVLLTSFGLIMVLSASSITSSAGGEGNPFSVFLRQAMFAVVGMGLMFVVARFKVKTWKKLAPVLLIGGLLLQVLPLTPLGVEVNGNRSWFSVGGGFRIQPAEFVKIALSLYVGRFMSTKIRELSSFTVVIPVLAATGLSIGLVIAGHDLGTGLVLIAVALGALFVGGLPWKWLMTLMAVAIAGVAVLVLTNANRIARIQAMFTGHSSDVSDPLGQHWQSNHGLYALASGGWLGVGLGGSREKWAWLPEAHNDFIFAIIGEELGLVGTLAVVLLFALLSYGIVRIIMRSQDRFVQTVSAGLLAWLAGQAFINISVVTGLLPVIGVPLPFVSYGGSSLAATLIAAGVLLSFARSEPGASEALASRGLHLRSTLLGRMSRKSKNG
ncbi:putative lipid II flippase FtsW [Brevibacterium paucivorans]